MENEKMTKIDIAIESTKQSLFAKQQIIENN